MDGRCQAGIGARSPGRTPLSSRSTAIWCTATTATGAVDRRPHPSNGPLRRLGAAVRQAVSRMSRQGWLAARREGNRAFYARHRTRTPPHRRAEPAHLRTGHRVGRALAHAQLRIGEAHRRAARQPAQRTNGAGLGAALRLDLDLAGGRARGGARSRASNGKTSEAIQLFVAEYARTVDRPRVARAVLGRRRDRSRLSRFHRPVRPAPVERALGGGLSDEDAFVERLWLVHDYRKFAYARSGLAERAAAGALAGDDRRRALSRILRGDRPKSQRYFHLCARVHDGASGRASKRAAPCPNACLSFWRLAAVAGRCRV